VWSCRVFCSRWWSCPPGRRGYGELQDRRERGGGSEPQSGPPVEGIRDVGKGLSKGGQVPVVHPPGIEGGGELGQRGRRAGWRRVLMRPQGQLPGPVVARGRAPIRRSTPCQEHDRRPAPAARQSLSGRRGARVVPSLVALMVSVVVLSSSVASEAVGTVSHNEPVIAAWRSRGPPPIFDDGRDNLPQGSGSVCGSATILAVPRSDRS
jgi:hypothetical protein